VIYKRKIRGRLCKGSMERMAVNMFPYGDEGELRTEIQRILIPSIEEFQGRRIGERPGLKGVDLKLKNRSKDYAQRKLREKQKLRKKKTW